MLRNNRVTYITILSVIVTIYVILMFKGKYEGVNLFTTQNKRCVDDIMYGDYF